MGLRVKGQGGSAAPDLEAGDDDETDEEFEERIYDALMHVARASSSRVRSSLGSCVLMRTAYAASSDDVKEAIRDFIEEADL